MKLWACLAAVLSVFLIGNMQAAWASPSATVLSTHGAWKVHSFIDAGKKVCFISGQPHKQEGKYKRRGMVQFFITHWAGEKDRNVVSISAGYSYRKDSQATVTIDGKAYKLSTQGEMAWSHSQTMDDAITTAVQSGGLMVVEGVSTRGTRTTDTYDLKDMPAAYAAFVTACAPQ